MFNVKTEGMDECKGSRKEARGARLWPKFTSHLKGEISRERGKGTRGSNHFQLSLLVLGEYLPGFHGQSKYSFKEQKRL